MGAQARARVIGLHAHVGSGIDVAAVGQGRVQLSGAGTADDGQYSIDGASFVALPSSPFATTFGLVSAPAVGG